MNFDMCQWIGNDYHVTNKTSYQGPQKERQLTNFGKVDHATVRTQAAPTP